MRTLTYAIRLKPQPDGSYAVTVPALPGCMTWGKTHAHALRMARRSIASYIDSLAEEGAPIPYGPPSTVPLDTLVRVRVPVEV